MKFSTILAIVVTTKAAAAQDLVITTDDCSSCSVGTFCTTSLPQCHEPPVEGACFNATINEFQLGCTEGYDCFDNMCECVIDDYYPTAAPTAAPTSAPTRAPTTAPTTGPTTAPTAAPTAAPTDAPTNAPSPESGGFFSPCPTGTYWEIGATACRGPRYAGECYNPATAMFQNGCAAGFTCISNKCSTIPPATFSPSVCYLQCPDSEFCENGTSVCRGPTFAGECFNIATGRFQNGCGAGYRCASNQCVRG
ncbi:hypothetical protein GN244_ATG08237 [Phytophthora infestans]|uniref:Carbohydrate-binding protein n=1 Tax=Phytophthora infestans TaxID=4787 RepID=A0A833WF25_PHYIN|nr:hypothetical protein GN244_ATG08237 [Phytophthora infestans]